MREIALKLDHVALPIFAIEESYRFYGETLGLPLLSALDGADWEGFPWLMMIFGLGQGGQLALVALRGAERPASALPEDAQHVAFTVGSERELARWKERLEQAGITPREEDHGAQRSLYFKDPNQIVLELTTAAPTPEVDEDAPAIVRRFLAAG